MLQNPNYPQNKQTKSGMEICPDEFPKSIESIAANHVNKLAADGISVGNKFKGVPVAPGIAVGPAAVIDTLEDLQRIRPNSILICSRLSPEISVVFAFIGGIIAERGGVMSTPATIARENGLPVVSAVRSAARNISNGDLVRLDGSEGTVQIISKTLAYSD